MTSRSSGSYTRLFCRHPSLGFLRFGSYHSAKASEAPDPRGAFVKRADAEYRRRESFYTDGVEYDGQDIEIVEVSFSWEVKS